MHKGLAEQIVKHPHAREIFVFLELKPLFVSSVIFNDRGKLPYRKVAEFLGEGLSTTRKKITVLKRMKLLRVDGKKNFHLAKYDDLRELFQHHTKRKYKLLNNGSTQHLVKTIAIYENLKRQEYVRNKKILERELINEFARKNMLDPLNSRSNPIVLPLNAKGCEKYFSKRFIRNYTKMLRKSLDVRVEQYKKIYNAQILQTEIQFPYINPNLTLSCKGIARVLGKQSASTGHYQSRKMEAKELLSITGAYHFVPATSPAIYENDLAGIRSDIYSYKFPLTYRFRRQLRIEERTEEIQRGDLRGEVRLYFRNAPNKLFPNENSLFF